MGGTIPLTELTYHRCPIIRRPKPLLVNVTFTDERVQIDWQWPLSGVYSIMMVNSAQPDEGGVHGAWFPLFTPSTITSKIVLVYSFKLRGQIHSSYFFSIPFLLCGELPKSIFIPPPPLPRTREGGGCGGGNRRMNSALSRLRQ